MFKTKQETKPTADSTLAPSKPNPTSSPPPSPAPTPGVPPRPRTRRTARILFRSVIVIVLLCGLGFSAATALYFYITNSLPPAEQLATVAIQQSTKIYDRNGGLLYEIIDPNKGRRTNVTPDKIAPLLKQATIATEDPSFYSNPGVDWVGVLRAIYYLARNGRATVGGSTITQQLVKNALLSPEPTIDRKIREAIYAFEITRRYPKEQILAMYLNTIYYGNLSYGTEEAAQFYFKKDVGQLDLGEASLLAGLPQAPALYDPCDNPDAALDRQKIVLGRMIKEGYIKQPDADAASSEMDAQLHSDEFDKNCNAVIKEVSPHFVEYVRAQLEQEYGPEVVYKGGLQVYTSLDPTLQKLAEDEAKKQVTALKKNNVSSAAVVAVNPQTGEIYAMVGSVDFNDKSIDGQVNVADRLRQPGSSIKPLNYITALEKGWTLATPLLDIKTEFPNDGQPYTPVDYDGKEHGIVNVRIALANSLNIPAVKTLYFVTVPEMINTARKFGITSFKDPSQYGLALTLGGGDVKLVELTGAYAAIANEGQRAALTPYRKIVDTRGQTIFDIDQYKASAQKIVDPRYAYLIINILSDNNARAMEFGANSPLKTSRTTFAKTGTTNDFRDNWTLGGTPELVVGVWVGNPRNQPMQNVTGITGAAPIWHNLIERAYAEDDAFKKIAPHDFTIPPGLVQVTVCNESGLLPNDLCPANHRHAEIFLAEQAPKDKDNLWVKVKIDRTNNLLASDQCPQNAEERSFMKMPQDVVMPYEQVIGWANAHGIPQPPTQVSSCNGGPPAQNTHPQNNGGGKPAGGGHHKKKGK